MVFWFTLKTEKEMALRNIILLPLSFILLQAGAIAGVINEREATQQARLKYEAKVLAVKSVDASNTSYFKIKLLLKNGRIKTVFIDTNTGEFLKKEPQK